MPRAISTKPQVYLFFGEEGFLIRQLADRVVDSLLPPDEREFNLTVLETDPAIPELLQLVESAPFFVEQKVVVIRNTKLFQAARRRAVADDAGDAAEEEGDEGAKEAGDSADPRLLQLLSHMPPYSTLIFTATKADKRRKLTKAVAENGQVQELNPFRPHEEREIRSWVDERLALHGKQLDREAM